MNSHVLLKLGVAYKASLKHIVQYLILSVVFSGIIKMANSAPTNSALDMVKLPFEKNPPIPTYLFLTAQNNMWLEILEDGTVRANTCRTKYGALTEGSHSRTREASFTTSPNRNDNQSVIFLKGAVSNRFLCVTPKGHVYAAINYSEDNCGFFQEPRFEITGATVHFYKHSRHKYPANRGHRRFQLGFKKDGTVFVVKHVKDRKEENKPNISISKMNETIADLNGYKKECDHKVQRRFKFCRTVWKNFFNAKIIDLRRFRRYDCWEKIRRHKQDQKIKGGTG